MAIEYYELVLCGTCRHPAGQHLYAGGCRLAGCTCSGWVEGGTGRWSDDLTDRLGGFRVEVEHVEDPPLDEPASDRRSG